MPVVFMKYKPNCIPDEVMQKLVAELPRIFADALSVPEDPEVRLTPGDIQIWDMPAGKFDVGLQDLQMMIPLHPHPERIKNLEQRKDKITNQIRDILAGHDLFGGVNVKGWVWILPSSETAFGKF